MQIAVLGASGFIGSRVVEFFHLRELATVRPIVRSYANMAALSRFDLNMHLADACDETALQKAFAGCEMVIHTVVGDPSVILSSVSATYKACQLAGVKRLIYLSTASVHGQAPLPGTSEASQLSHKQSLMYNNAKVKAERQLMQLHKNGNVELVILRPSIVFGPRSARWTVTLADDLLAGKAYLINNGEGICNTIYIDNLVHAINLALQADKFVVDGQAFLVGDAESITWLEFLSVLAKALAINPDTIARVSPPCFSKSIKDRLQDFKATKAVQTLLPFIPAKIKKAAKATIAAWQEDKLISEWSQLTKSSLTISEEMTLLQQCSYKLPYTKASQLLGYQPLVSLEEAFARTISWLAFAGYPVSSRIPINSHIPITSNIEN